MQKSIHSFQDLQVYQLAFQCSVEVYQLAQQFPQTSADDLAHRVLAPAHAVRAHIAKAWGQRRKREALIHQLSSAQLEVLETQIAIEAAICAGYVQPDAGQDLCDRYRCIYAVLDQLMESAARSTSPKNDQDSTLPATA